MTRAISAAGLELVERNEGLRLGAYRDVAGIWTIGYGHTPAKATDRITEAEATELLKADLRHAEDAVSKGVGDAPTTDNQFSAMVSLAFNIGAGAFARSTVLRKHLAQDAQGAADAFLMWSKSHVNGRLVMVPGLLRRRMEERALYMAGTDEAQTRDPAVSPAVSTKVSIGPSLFGRLARLFG